MLRLPTSIAGSGLAGPKSALLACGDLRSRRLARSLLGASATGVSAGGPRSGGLAGWRRAERLGRSRRGGCRAVRFQPGGRASAGMPTCPGRGNSSPSSWDDVVLLTTALDETDPPTLAVLCFDRSDGAMLWQAEAGPAQRPDAREERLRLGHAWPPTAGGSSPSSAAPDCSATISARQAALAGRTGRPRPPIGARAASPVLYGDTVIQLCDCEKRLVHRGVRQDHRPASSGGRRGPATAAGATPVFVEAKATASSATEMVVNGTEGKRRTSGMVIAYDPADGRELWRVRGTDRVRHATPLVGGGLVYSTSGRNGPIIGHPPRRLRRRDRHARRLAARPRRAVHSRRASSTATGCTCSATTATLTCYNAGSGASACGRRGSAALSRPASWPPTAASTPSSERGHGLRRCRRRPLRAARRERPRRQVPGHARHRRRRTVAADRDPVILYSGDRGATRQPSIGERRKVTWRRLSPARKRREFACLAWQSAGGA